MAKDDWDIDDDPNGSKGLDDFDRDMNFDFDPMDMRDDRKPVTKFASAAAREIASMRGAGRFVKKVAFEAMPDGYKNAYGTAKGVKDSVSDIYDTSIRAAQPTIQTVKRLGRLTIPAAEKILPKSVTERLKRATAKEERYASPNREELEIAQTLTSIFDAQQKSAELGKREDDAKEEMQLNIAKKQFSTNLEVQRQISEGIGRLVGYQDGVLAKYHRKSLELQHRHYFASKELLAFTKKTNEVMVEQLKVIVKNTALPNEMKVQLNEQFMRQSKERLIGAVTDSSMNKLRNLPSKIAEGAKSRALEAVEMMNMMSDMVNGMIDSSGLEDGDSGGFGMDPYEMMGSATGDMVRDSLAKKAVNSKFFQDILKDKRVAGKLQKGNNMANIFVESLPRYLNTKMKKGDHWLWKVLADFAGSDGMLGEDKVSVNTNLDKNALATASWDVLSRRTLIEVIPGYLSRMLVELETINRDVPPDQKASRIVWSNERESFITAKQQQIDIRSKFEKQADTRLKSYADELTKTMGADKTLSPGALAALKLRMTKESGNMEYFDPRVFADMGGEHGDEIAAFMESKYKLSQFAGQEDDSFLKMAKNKANYFKGQDPQFFDDYLKSMVLFNQLASATPNFQDVVKGEMAGGLEGLRNAGFVTTDSGGVRSAFNEDYKAEMIKKILAGEKLSFFADGGDVNKGKNTTPNDEDTVAALMKKGEFVIPKEVVDKRGRKFFEDIISGRDQDGNRNKASMFKRKGIDPLYEAFDSANESLRVSLVGANQERQLEILMQISDALQHGYVVNSDGTVSQTGYMGQFGKDSKKVINKGFRALWKGVRKGNDIRNEMFGKFKDKMLKPGMEMGGKAARWIGAHVADRLELGKEMVTDLYVKGMKSPLLTEAKMRLGHYYYVKEDGTRVFIKSWDEIKGEAVDIYDVSTGSIIVFKDQLKDLYSMTRPKLNGFFRKLRTKAGNLFLAQFDAAKAVLDFSKNIARKVYRAVTAPVDVYVKGKMNEGPRLRKIIFLNGGYTDALGNIIDHHDKINGPVYSVGADMKMEMRLSMEDIQEGLVDSAGDPIEGTGLAGKIIAKGYRLGKAAADIMYKSSKFTMELAKNVGGTILGVTGRAAGSLPGFGFNSGIETRLDKILRHMRLAFPVSGEDDDLIKSELPIAKASASMKAKMETMREAIIDKKNRAIAKLKAKRDAAKAAMDLDGDGDTEGSWRDILQRRKEKAKAGVTNVVAKAKAAIPAWKQKMGEKKEDPEDGILGMFGEFFQFYVFDKFTEALFSIVPGGVGQAGRAPLLAAKVAKLKRAGKWLRGAIGGAAKGLGKVAAVVGGGLLKGGAKAVGGLLKGGAKMVGGAAKGLGKMLGFGTKGIGKFGKGAGVVGGFMLKNPALLWASAGVAAALYGGQKIKEALRRRKELKPIEKLRFLQYGIPINNKDARVEIHYLEQRVIGRIRLSPDGGFKLGFKWHDIWEEFHDDFGCDEEDVKQQARFRSWFYYRFLPVFIWHMRAAKRIEKLNVFDVDDKMTPKLKQDYVKQVQFGTKEALTLKLDPYSVMESPWKEIELQDTADSIQSLSNDIIKASKEGKNLDGDEATKVDKKEKAEEDKNKTTKETSVGGFFKHIVKKTLGIDKDSDYQRDKTQAEKEDERRLANARNLGQARRQGAVLKTKEYDYKQAQDSSLQEEFNKLNGAGVKGTPKLLFPTEPAKVNSPFGTRTDPFGSGAKQAHKGIDIKVPAGTPVYAAADGRVVLAQILKGYGLVIYLQHDDGTSTRYAHLSGLMPNIKVGAVVRAGQQIAYSGGIKGLPTSGRSEGPHLHFEYRDANAGATSNDAKPLNPIAYFKGLDKGNVDMVVEAGEPEKPKDDMGSKPIIPTPPKATSGQIAAIKTTPPGTQPVPSVKGEIATTSGNPVVAGTTNVNVAPPNLDPLNKTIVDTSKGSSAQRDEQISLMRENNNLMAALIQRYDQQNQASAAASAGGGRSPMGGPTKVNSVIDLSVGA